MLVEPHAIRGADTMYRTMVPSEGKGCLAELRVEIGFQICRSEGFFNRYKGANLRFCLSKWSNPGGVVWKMASNTFCKSFLYCAIYFRIGSWSCYFPHVFLVSFLTYLFSFVRPLDPFPSSSLPNYPRQKEDIPPCPILVLP